MAISRSISMSQIPKRSVSIQSQSSSSVQLETRVETMMKKAYRVLERVMFTNKNEHAKKYDKSVTNPLLQVMLIFGISWLTAKNMRSGWPVVLIAVYNMAVFLVQSIYLILLVIDFYVSNVGEYKWITTSFYLYAILLVMSIWLNIRIHLIHGNTIAEAVCSYSVSSKFVNLKNKSLKILCFVFIFLSFFCIALFVLAYKLSNDLFGIGSSKPTHIFSCGIFCNIAFYYISFIVIVTFVCATGLFSLLTVSTLMEAKQLGADIRKYPSKDGLDHLIFRYQSIDQSAYAVNKHFSCIIFGLIFFTIGGVIVLLRHYTQLMVGSWETGAALLLFYFILGSLCLTTFIMLATILNNQLCGFRRVSQRVSDFQQIYTTNQNSVKLLSFMLRLSNSKQHLKIAGICSINQQTIFTLVIVSIMFGFLLYTSDSGCLHVF